MNGDSLPSSDDYRDCITVQPFSIGFQRTSLQRGVYQPVRYIGPIHLHLKLCEYAGGVLL